MIFTSYFPPFCQHSQPLEREKSFLSPFPKKQVTKMKILPASNGSTGASSSSSSTSSQVSGLKLGIVRLGRAAGKVNTSSSSSFACYHSPVILSRIQSTLSLSFSPLNRKVKRLTSQSGTGARLYGKELCVCVAIHKTTGRKASAVINTVP